MGRILLDMDREWKFHLGEIVDEVVNSHSASYSKCKAGNVTGAGGKIWNDSDWRVLDLPHDYLAESDFSKDNLISHGYRTRNNAWYRKSFILDPSLEDKQLLLCFEGTAVNAEFYFNGSLMARSFSAYTETVFDITERAYFDGRANVLAVHINGFETEGWWYEGSGIYRHVRLYAKDKLHIAHNGIFAKPVLKSGTKNSWNVELETTVENSDYAHTSLTVHASIYDGDVLITESTSAVAFCDYAAKTEVHQKLSVSRPTRWDVDNPKLYTLKVDIIQDGKIVDSDSTRIGFRTFSVDAQKGFFLNGRPLKIKGTCNHQDHAGVGVAVPDSIQYYRIQRLKELGTNAYRCSHNLPTKEVLDACDELGLIVMDENRRFEARKEVLEYLEIMVRRDRNHPSVIFWSLFNEEPLQNTAEGAKIFRKMRSVVEHLDDSRLIMGSINGNMEGAGQFMDVTGINYAIGAVEAMHAKYPNQPIIGSENNSAVSTRGCYKSDKIDAHVLANYDEELVPWGQSIRTTWDFTRKHDYFAGIFIWTGFDYRGEPTPFEWPSVSSQFGIMDTCGFPKDSFYFNKACFTDKPMVHLLPHWNWKKGDTVRVMAVSNCDEVELFLNGKSLGRKPNDICTNNPEWQVEFVPGRISAKAYRNGKTVAKAEQRTAGKPYALKITTNTLNIKDDGQDTVVVNVSVVDKKGIIVPCADNLIKFEVIGDGFVRGVGNGDPNSHELDNIPERHAFCGLCQALITSRLNADGITVRAHAEGLLEDSVTLNVCKITPPVIVESVNNTTLSGFTASSVTSVRPDPLVKLADNDMNSFTAVELSGNNYQIDYLDGWRIYRVQPQIFNKTDCYVRFSKVCFNYAEIYVDGKLIDKVEGYLNGEYRTPFFKVNANSKSDIRILMYIDKAPSVEGAGIAGVAELFTK